MNSKPDRSLPQLELFGSNPNSGRKAKRKARSSKTVAKETPAIPALSAPIAPPPNALLDVRRAAARLGLSKSTLDKMRMKGKGPPFVKSTDRSVRYDPIDLDKWIDERRRQSS
ncbi:helix-turn-helix transcriptional regulator [Vitreimonas flagellata]|uniref:helix-turn-helix transcriptional regulator n=1 Tax=Vitreimonas flagellata TaxID=2560861 RepID=UPI001075878F|nr:helix-turn-helix domain-containing protein [Vitreimonas flagellata]